MAVEHEFDLIADLVADRVEHIGGAFQRVAVERRATAFQRHALERPRTMLDVGARLRPGFLGCNAEGDAAVVDAHAVAPSPAQQLVHGDVPSLAGDVVQRHIDGRHGRAEH